MSQKRARQMRHKAQQMLRRHQREMLRLIAQQTLEQSLSVRIQLALNILTRGRLRGWVLLGGVALVLAAAFVHTVVDLVGRAGI